MNIRSECLKSDEIVTYKLRSIYSEYGYEHYKVNKFEEYDFYVRNKTFLVSENILSFTDTNGKLMALKPDVTFSIIKITKTAARKRFFTMRMCIGRRRIPDISEKYPRRVLSASAI